MPINDPRDIPGLLVWYSAEAETGYADGAAMTRWTDLSGNANHATPISGAAPLWRSIAGAGGGPAVEIGRTGTTNQGFTLPNIMAGATSGEAVLLIKSSTDTGNNTGHWDFGTNAQSNYYPYGGSIYDDFGSGTQQIVNPTPTIDVWRRYGAWSAPSDFAMLLDGATIYTTTTNTVAWSTAPLVGGKNVVASALGHVAGLVVYNRKLTTTERADLDTYFVAHMNGGTTPPTQVVIQGEPFTVNAAALTGTAGHRLDTATSNAAHFVQLSGVGYVDSNPPVAPVPSALQRGYDYVKAMAYTQPTMTNGRPVDYAPYFAEAKAHRDRIVVGGKDVTYFRGAQTPMPAFTLTQPFAYGATTLVFPQTHAAFEQAGAGELSWLRKEARVKFQRINVDTGQGEGVDYRGVITAVRTEGRNWVADVGGDLSGRASMRDEQPPLFRWVRDIARHVHDGVQSMHLRVADAADIGIGLAKQGGMSHLDWLNHLCRMAVKKDGTTYTLMPSAANEKVWEFRTKDTTTRHATAYFDAANVVADLTDDLEEQPNMIYGTGVTREGMKVKNGRYPGLKQAAAPAYPFADNRTFGVGDDLSTATPGTIAAMNWRLIGAKYLDERDDVNQFDNDTADAVEDLQEDAGLSQTGRMDPATWDALFDLTVTGASLRQSSIEPMAQATYVRKWNRTGSGARASRNAGYDPTRLQVHRTVDFGSGHSKRRMVRWARRERLSLMGKNWVGTITVNTRGLVRGDHTPGAPLTAADVMPARELRPGMNVWAPLFDGGTLFHVSGIQVQEGGRTAVLTVDTKARDMLEVWEIVDRNRASRRDPARAWLREYRRRGQIDSVITYDEVGGQVFDTITCPANQWTVFWVVGGQEGTIRRLRLQTADPVTYSLSVWGKDPGEANLNLKVPTPLALDTNGETVWSSNLPIFDNRILLGAWGDDNQPCGYAPGKHMSDNGSVTTDPITGLFVDEGGFSYHTDTYPVLYVAIWPTSATTIKPQRIMWPQLEEGQ